MYCIIILKLHEFPSYNTQYLTELHTRKLVNIMSHKYCEIIERVCESGHDLVMITIPKCFRFFLG